MKRKLMRLNEMERRVVMELRKQVERVDYDFATDYGQITLVLNSLRVMSETREGLRTRLRSAGHTFMEDGVPDRVSTMLDCGLLRIMEEKTEQICSDVERLMEHTKSIDIPIGTPEDVAEAIAEKELDAKTTH